MSKVQKWQTSKGRIALPIKEVVMINASRCVPISKFVNIQQFLDSNVDSQFYVCQWLARDFLKYLDEGEREKENILGPAKEKERVCLSRETFQGLQITGITHLVYKGFTCSCNINYCTF